MTISTAHPSGEMGLWSLKRSDRDGSPLTWHIRTVVHAAVMTGTSVTPLFLTRTVVLSGNLSEASRLEATLNLRMLSNTLRL